MSELQHLPHEHSEPDSWHRHAASEGVPQQENGSTVNPTAIGITFVAISFTVVFVILILIAYFNNYRFTLQAQLQEGVPQARSVFETKKSIAQTRLSSYGWIDRDAGTVHIPIEIAYGTVVAEYAQGADAR